MSTTSGARALPSLREDLRLLPGPAADDGSPRWTLFDPVRNRYFRLGAMAFELLSRWREGSAETLVARVRAETPQTPEAADVEALERFLTDQELVQSTAPAAAAALGQRARRQRSRRLQRLVHGYLFFRLPLVRPDRFLARTQGLVAPLYSRTAALAVVAAGLLGLFLASRQWDTFVATFLHLFSLEGLLYYGITLAGVKAVHELGHAYTAKRYGCRVPTMGVAFLVLFPVLYTDTTDAWRIRDRRRRLAIDAAGITTEIALAAVATLLWSLLPDGPARTAAFLVATTSWVLSLTLNASPFMRFDGYYLLADWLGMDNLQERSFALGRWRLRRLLLGLEEAPPESFPPRRRRLLVAYAWATWVYRLVLFLGIALLVYHLAFKLLGILLAAIEVVWLILRPIYRELRTWWQRRRQLRLNRNLALSLLLLGLGLAALLVPWNSRVGVPAVHQAARSVTLYPPTPARVAVAGARPGDRVEAGSVLFRLASPELEQRLRLVEIRSALLEQRLRRSAANREDLERVRVLRQELATQVSARAGYREELAALAVRAPFPGRVVAVAEGLVPGRWVAGDLALARLVDPASGEIKGYTVGQDFSRLEVGAAAVFYPDDPARPPLHCRVTGLDPVNVPRLDVPALASPYGGPIPARLGPDGELVPEKSVYRVTLRPEPPAPAPTAMVRGLVQVEAPPRSLLDRAWRTVAAVLIRESGF